MPEIPFATQAYKGRYKGLPALTLENMYVEESPGDAMDEVHLVQCPGKTQLHALTGAGRGLWRIKGGPTSELIAVHGSTVSRITSAWAPTTIGSVLSQTTPCRITSSPEHVVVVDDPNGYVYDGSSFSQISDPDLGSITDAAYSSGYWGYIRDGELKISAFGDPTDLDTLDYVGVGKWPDDCVALREQSDDFIIWGEEAIEVFPPSGDSDAPFYARPGSRIDVGCVGTHSVVFGDQRWWWCGRERDAGDPGFYVWPGKRVSTHAIDDCLRAMTEAHRSLIKGSSYGQGGHTFIQWDLPGQGSFVHDAATGRWHRRRRFQETLERVMAFEAFAGKIVAQGRDGGLYALDPDLFLDGDDPLRWAFTANLAVKEQRLNVASFQVVGTAGEITDPNRNPMLFMRYSSGDGANWSGLRNTSIGRTGERQKRVRFLQLGEAKPPGRVFEVSGDAAARFTPTACVVNGAY